MSHPQDFVRLTMDAARDSLQIALDQLRALHKAGADANREIGLVWDAWLAVTKYYADPAPIKDEDDSVSRGERFTHTQ